MMTFKANIYKREPVFKRELSIIQTRMNQIKIIDLCVGHEQRHKLQLKKRYLLSFILLINFHKIYYF